MMGTSPETMASTQSAIIEEFQLLEDPLMQYEYLIDLGKRLPPLLDQYRTEENLVRGCQSIVYLHSEFRDGKMIYSADSNTVITKGIIALLIRVLSGQKPDDIV